MKTFLKSGLMIVSTILFSIIIFSITPSIAKEKKQESVTSEGQRQVPERVVITGKRYNIETTRETTKIDDVEGHYLTIVEYKGVNIENGVPVISTIISDTIKGNGTFFGYFKGFMPDGGVYYGKSEGNMTTILSPSGKPVTTSEGTWSITNFQMAEQNYVGDGIFSTKVIVPGISSMQFKGEMRLSK